MLVQQRGFYSRNGIKPSETCGREYFVPKLADVFNQRG
jgi:hypothetical protein